MGNQTNQAKIREIFFRELGRLLKLFYENHKLRGHCFGILKYRMEGFKQAGVRLGLIEGYNLHRTMEDIHLNVFGLTTSERCLEELKGDNHPEDRAYYDTSVTQRNSKI